MQNISMSRGEGRSLICMQATLTEDGLAVILTGGEKPHVGGMAMSVPYPGSSRPNTWIIPRRGHRDSDAATQVAELLCRKTSCCTAVISGIHIEQATAEEIELLLENSRELARQLGDKIKQIQEIDHA